MSETFRPPFTPNLICAFEGSATHIIATAIAKPNSLFIYIYLFYSYLLHCFLLCRDVRYASFLLLVKAIVINTFVFSPIPLLPKIRHRVMTTLLCSSSQSPICRLHACSFLSVLSFPLCLRLPLQYCQESPYVPGLPICSFQTQLTRLLFSSVLL